MNALKHHLVSLLNSRDFNLISTLISNVFLADSHKLDDPNNGTMSFINFPQVFFIHILYSLTYLSSVPMAFMYVP